MSATEGQSTTLGAAINLAKVCIGAGALALPYATERGGLLFSPIIMALVAAWNGIACRMMIECKRSIDGMYIPHGISSTYSKIAYAGAGYFGVFLTDFSIIVTLLGVCIAYQITFATLFHEIPSCRISKTVLTIISGLIVLPVSCAKDVSILSWSSFAGLICLIIGVLSIIIYGLWNYGTESIEFPMTSESGRSLSFIPLTFSDATTFVGVATFCFGLCSLAFPIEESMKNKEEFGKAVTWSLIFVWFAYVAIGDLGSFMYIHDVSGIKDNILSNLPQDSLSASLVRLSMACVCVLTYPLTFMPPAQMIENYVFNFSCMRWLTGFLSNHHYDRVGDVSTDGGEDVPYTTRIATRCALVMLTTFLATSVPCFAMVISLLGGFTVAILSFVLPPLLHMYIITYPAHQRAQNATCAVSVLDRLPVGMDKGIDRDQIKYQYYEDWIYTIVGVALSFVATTVTTMDVVNKLSTGGSCT